MVWYTNKCRVSETVKDGGIGVGRMSVFSTWHGMRLTSEKRSLSLELSKVYMAVSATTIDRSTAVQNTGTCIAQTIQLGFAIHSGVSNLHGEWVFSSSA